ncbi:hypothetical protein [Kosakonia sacchari]
MKAQLSRERLEEKLLEHIKHGGDSEEETMIRMLLAGMDSEPLMWVNEDSLPANYPYAELFPFSKVDVVRQFPVFAPPAPAPVAVPDVLSIIERHAERLEAEGRAADGFAEDQRKRYAAAILRGVAIECRAAMQAEPVTAATVPPHIYRELVNQLRDTAVKYQGCQQLREQLSATLRTVITPAAPEQEV